MFLYDVKEPIFLFPGIVPYQFPSATNICLHNGLLKAHSPREWWSCLGLKHFFVCCMCVVYKIIKSFFNEFVERMGDHTCIWPMLGSIEGILYKSVEINIELKNVGGQQREWAWHYGSPFDCLDPLLATFDPFATRPFSVLPSSNTSVNFCCCDICK